MMADVEAAANILTTCQFRFHPSCMNPYHAKKFQKPAKKPQTRPYLPAVIEAQWYTPPEDGIADASSARDAAIKQ